MLYEEDRYCAPNGRTSILKLLKACPFATLISFQGLAEPIFSHIPILVDGQMEIGGLRAHVSRANMHADALVDGSVVMVIFQGPNAYISPTWYAEPTKRAPTWNYAVVHVLGRVTRMTDDDQVDEMLNGLAARGEASIPQPWVPEKYDCEIRARLRRGILGVSISVDRVQAKFKLNQHNTEFDRLNAAANLEKTGGDYAKYVARLMRESLGQK